MLVLTRKDGEKITLQGEDGSQIEITIRLRRLGSCSICIEAPQSFKISRTEKKPPNSDEGE
jgi:sRNA-binding carbon storage regulator CsrA